MCTLSDTNSIGWYFQDPETGDLMDTIPKCTYICEEKPPIEGDYYNVSWVEGSVSVGNVATYKCSGECEPGQYRQDTLLDS